MTLFAAVRALALSQAACGIVVATAALIGVHEPDSHPHKDHQFVQHRSPDNNLHRIGDQTPKRATGHL